MFGFFVNFSFRLCYNKCMDQNKVNPFSENPASSAGSAPAPQSSPNVPVNPYAPAGAPYAPGSNTPPPDYAITSGDAPAVPNTAPRFSTPDPAFTSVPNNYPSASPEKPKFFTKKFVILASAGVVLILAAVATGLILQNNRSNNTNTGSGTNNINELANLLVDGQSEKTTPDFSLNEWYFEQLLISARDSNESINDYINALKQSSNQLTSNNFSGLKNDVTAYLDCLAVDHYESDAAAKKCRSLINTIKVDVKSFYNQETGA